MKWLRTATAVAGCVALLTGCSAEQPDAVSSTPPAQPSSGAAVPSATSPERATGEAVACAGKPSADEVLALVRREEPPIAVPGARVGEGPLCAEDWQITVLMHPDTDPLMVVTNLRDGTLTLVTAGTELCNQLDAAPLAIRRAAHATPEDGCPV